MTVRLTLTDAEAKYKYNNISPANGGYSHLYNTIQYSYLRLKAIEFANWYSFNYFVNNGDKHAANVEVPIFQ